MRHIAAVALLLMIAFPAVAAEENAVGVTPSTGNVSSVGAGGSTFAPDALGRYSGNFVNMGGKASPMGLGAVIDPQASSVTMYAGSCSGKAQTVMVKKLDGNQYVLSTIEGASCPVRLEVVIEKGRIDGKMFGSNTYDVSLRK